MTRPANIVLILSVTHVTSKPVSFICSIVDNQSSIFLMQNSKNWSACNLSVIFGQAHSLFSRRPKPKPHARWIRKPFSAEATPRPVLSAYLSRRAVNGLTNLAQKLSLTLTPILLYVSCCILYPRVEIIHHVILQMCTTPFIRSFDDVS